ncbi:MAG: tetratricopeptide repeat protein [Elusimicrobiales bacterium]|nr:tetratricopeptide repeat protein [Elusimicrobiales bacterium]
MNKLLALVFFSLVSLFPMFASAETAENSNAETKNNKTKSVAENNLKPVADSMPAASKAESDDGLKDLTAVIPDEQEILSEDVSDISLEPEISSETAHSDAGQKTSSEEEAWMTLFPFSPAAMKDPSPQDTRSFSEISQAEYWFLKENLSAAKDDDTRKALLLAVDEWITAFKDSEHADDILLAKAELYMGLGDSRKALITLMKHRQAYPDSLLKEVVKEKLSSIISRKYKKHETALKALAEAEGNGRTSRLARLYSGLAEQFGDEFFDPLVSEFRALLAAVPVYAYRDRLLFSLAQLYHSRGHYDEAAITYAEVIRVYPEGTIIPAAKLAIAEIQAREKRNYPEAIRIYEEIALKYEGQEEAFAAYKELPRLLERQKEYEEAVNIYEKIIELYPDKPEARDAYRAETSILRYELKHYGEAIHVIKRMAEKYKDNRAKNDLYGAADIARNNLKSLDEELKIYDIIAKDYADPKNAPAALLAAAQACERAKEPAKAENYYNKILNSWPASPQAKKAAKALGK